MVNRIGLIGWVLLAVVIAFGVLRANAAGAKLEELRQQNAVLTARNTEQAQRVAYAEERVAEADAAATADSLAAAQRVAAAARRAADAEDRMRAALEDRPDLAVLFDSVTAAHEAELQAERDRAQRQDRLRLAQIHTRDDLIGRQRDQIETQAAIISNLEDQVSTLDPPFFVGLFRDLPKLAATAGGAYVGSLVGQETGAAIGAAVGSLAF